MATVSLTKKQPGTVKRIELENYLNTSIRTSTRSITINEVLPFRVRFSAIRIPAGGPAVVPPIPLQIIGYSNYIL
jgi:hypothetical protein